VVPVVAELSERFPNVVISIDTYQSAVALEAVAAGAGMVNDISGGSLDPEMIETVARLNVPYVCMHIKGTPETMHLNPSYDHVTKEVLDYFIQKCEACRNAGIHDVILDPGFGFGKNAMHNFQLLNDLSVFRMLGKPLLAGLSRKSTVYKTLGTTAEAALNGTTVMNTLCLLNGADILRVHDVKEAVEAVKLVSAYREAAPSGT
jgi:dihydropteroate synthase